MNSCVFTPSSTNTGAGKQIRKHRSLHALYQLSFFFFLPQFNESSKKDDHEWFKILRLISSVTGIILSVGREYFAPSNLFSHIIINFKMVSGKKIFLDAIFIFRVPLPSWSPHTHPKKVFCVRALGFRSWSVPSLPFSPDNTLSVSKVNIKYELVTGVRRRDMWGIAGVGGRRGLQAELCPPRRRDVPPLINVVD